MEKYNPNKRYNPNIAAFAGGLMTVGMFLFAEVAHRYLKNQNIDPNYVKPKHAIVRTVDMNEDGYKEVVLEVPAKDGTKRTIDLTSENLEKLLRK